MMLNKYRMLLIGAIVIFVVSLVIAPNFLGRYGVYILSLWAVTSIAATGLNLTLGYAGQVSLAQGAFVGIGAYATALLLMNGVPFVPSVLASALICFFVGWLLGYPALRVQHHYLAFVTLAFSTFAYLFFRNEEWLTGGNYGLSGFSRPMILGWNTDPDVNFYYLCLATLVIAMLAMFWLTRSPWGRSFVTLRENPVRAMSVGVDTKRYTLMAFAIGAAFGGISGSLYAPLVEFVDPSSFPLIYSLNLLMMVIVGGSGFLFGPLLGAMVAVLLPEWLRFSEGYYLIIYTLLVILLLIYSPSGLLGIADRFLTARRSSEASRRRSELKGAYSSEKTGQ